MEYKKLSKTELVDMLEDRDQSIKDLEDKIRELIFKDDESQYRVEFLSDALGQERAKNSIIELDRWINNDEIKD